MAIRNLDALKGNDSLTLSLMVCKKEHGSEGNAASVYGHHGSVRNCIRLYGTDTWLYDPRWEQRK